MFSAIKNAMGGNSQQGQQQSTPPQQQDPKAAAAPDQIKPDGMNPGDPAKAGVANPDNPDAGDNKPNPLDAFKDMYSVDESGQKPAEVPTLQVTNELLDKVVPNVDFMQGMSAEIKQGLATGDPQAIVAAMQTVAANSYRTAMQHSSALVNEHLEKRLDSFKPTVKEEVNQTLTSQAIGALPNADNPVIRAELERVSAQLRKKFPTADSAWVAKQANVYLSELGSQLNPSQQQQQQASQDNLPETLDFAQFLELDK